MSFNKFWLRASDSNANPKQQQREEIGDEEVFDWTSGSNFKVGR